MFRDKEIVDTLNEIDKKLNTIVVLIKNKRIKQSTEDK